MFKNEVKDKINKLNNLIYTIDKYFGIYEDIINSYENKKRIYYLLQNIHDMSIFNNNIIQDINMIVNEKNIFKKMNNMIEIYNKINITKKDNNIKNEPQKKEEKNEIINKIEEKSGKKEEEKLLSKNKIIQRK